MLSDIQLHIDEILKTYSEGEFYDKVVEAKKKYFELTGLANEEDDDFETRMRSFNDWFIMHYPLEGEKTALAMYLDKAEITEEDRISLEGFRYSVFEFSGKSLSGKLIVKDLLRNEKIVFTEDSSPIPVFKGDIFIGRLICSGQDYLFMNGLCLLPKEGSSLIKKQIKKIRKLNEPEKENSFLLELENLKTKWKRFGHVDADKIFIFQN